MGLIAAGCHRPPPSHETVSESIGWRIMCVHRQCPWNCAGQPSMQTQRFAQETLEQRSFVGLDLRGADFRGAELIGADFRGADLRSADFRSADARDARFDQARLGRTIWRGFTFQLAVAVPKVLFSAYAILLSTALLLVLDAFPRSWFAWLCISFPIGMPATLIAIRGSRALTWDWVVGGGAGVLAGLGVGLGAFVGLALEVVAFNLDVSKVLTVVVREGVFGGSPAFVVAVVWQIASFALFWWRIRRRSPEYARGEPGVAALRSYWGTCFRNANLSGATFERAILAGADFRFANLKRVSWRHARLIHLARFSSPQLHDRRVESLLVDGKISQPCDGIDLRDARLDGVDLARISLRRADFTGASLRAANLEDANLFETTLIGSDLTQARLTGACIEAWNIDASTVLNPIDCRYVYLRENPNGRGDRERRPYDPSATFEPGDFNKLYQRVITHS